MRCIEEIKSLDFSKNLFFISDDGVLCCLDLGQVTTENLRLGKDF